MGLQDTPTQSQRSSPSSGNAIDLTTAFEKQQQRIRQNKEAEEYVSKEQGKTPGTDLNETEVIDMPDKEISRHTHAH